MAHIKTAILPEFRAPITTTEMLDLVLIASAAADGDFVQAQRLAKAFFVKQEDK